MKTRTRISRDLLLWSLLAFASSPFLLAQPGPGSMSLSIGAASFTPSESFSPLNGFTEWGTDGLYQARFAYPPTQQVAMAAGLESSLSLPTGAVVDQVLFEVHDIHPDSDISVYVHTCPNLAPCELSAWTETEGQNSWQFLLAPLAGLTIDNANASYYLSVAWPLYMGDDPYALEFRRVLINYHMAVAPPPAGATFNDVPTNHPFFQFIEALKASGITSGCNADPPLFCPDAPLTRGQMAVFLAKALGLGWSQ
jgi:hypothetical protein